MSKSLNYGRMHLSLSYKQGLNSATSKVWTQLQARFELSMWYGHV